jgi:hypothetical protein
MLDIFAAEAGGLSANWATVIAVGTLLLGTTSTTVVAIIQWLGNRNKNKTDAAKSIVEAAAGLLTPYATALEMANNQIKLLNEQDRQKSLQIRALQTKNRRLESRVDELGDIRLRTSERLEVCRLKLAAYETRYGPLTSNNG